MEADEILQRILDVLDETPSTGLTGQELVYAVGDASSGLWLMLGWLCACGRVVCIGGYRRDDEAAAICIGQVAICSSAVAQRLGLSMLGRSYTP